MNREVVERSRSFQEELRLSLQRRTTGVPALEDLLAKKNGGGGDQLMALLCTATIAAKLRAVNRASEQDDEPSPPPPPPAVPEHDEKASINAVATVEMTRLVDVWMGELAKLRGRRRPASSREVESEREEAEQVEAQETAAGAAPPRGQRLPRRRSTLSEATVCMLMDRFAPC